MNYTVASYEESIINLIGHEASFVELNPQSWD
jgi:hypothetical protein